MSELTDKIHRAQVRAGELAVMEDLHNRGLCMKESCLLCMSPAPQTMTPSLETKLAMILGYCEELRRNRTPRDNEMFNHYLDDPEVAEWLTKMNREGRTGNGRFITK